MLFIRSFINLLFVPVVALVLFYKKKSQRCEASFDTLLHYMIITACNIPLTRMSTFVIRKITGMNIEADSSYYTIAALLAAVLLPSIYNLGRRIWEALSEEEDEKGERTAE